MARLVVAEYRGYEDKSGTMDDGKAWSHRRLNLEDESGSPMFVKIASDRVENFRRPTKGEMVAYLVDKYDRVLRELPDAEALLQHIETAA